MEIIGFLAPLRFLMAFTLISKHSACAKDGSGQLNAGKRAGGEEMSSDLAGT